jgi:hypothetical protein
MAAVISAAILFRFQGPDFCIQTTKIDKKRRLSRGFRTSQGEYGALAVLKDCGDGEFRHSLN